jgi:hypothetical protein
MITATGLGLFFIPLFFVVVRRLLLRRRAGRPAPLQQEGAAHA